MKRAPKHEASARGLRLAVLHAAFNPEVTGGLLTGALAALREMGASGKDVRAFAVPGAFELPLAAMRAARSGRFDAVVALGAVIRGETDHYEHVAREAASGLAAVSRETGVPVAFGVLTTRTRRAATRRAATGPDNKGAEAARAAVAMVHALRAIGGGRRRPRKG
jgi:6,7-dimethyl-8-ribityllumazine synthase